MWAKAVWTEGSIEEEGTLPLCWIKGQNVFWPQGKSAVQAMKEMRQPTDTWMKFPLVKIKFQSENKKECDDHCLTTTAEITEDEEEDTLPPKRKVTKRKFNDCISESDGEESETVGISKKEANSNADKNVPDRQLPNPPKKQLFTVLVPESRESMVGKSRKQISKDSGSSPERPRRRLASLSPESSQVADTSLSPPSSWECSVEGTENGISPDHQTKRISREKTSNSTMRESSPEMCRLVPSRSVSSRFSRNDRSRSGSCRRGKKQSRSYSRDGKSDRSRSRSNRRRNDRSRSVSRRRLNDRCRSMSRMRNDSSTSGSRGKNDHYTPGSRGSHDRSNGKSTMRNDKFTPGSTSRNDRSTPGSSRRNERSLSRSTRRNNRSRSRPSRRNDRSRSRSRRRNDRSRSTMRNDSSRSRSRSRSNRSRSRLGEWKNTQRSKESTGRNILSSDTSSRPSSTKDLFPMDNGRFQKRVLFLLTEIRNMLKNGGGMLGPELINQEETLKPTSSLDEFLEKEQSLAQEEEKQQMKLKLMKIGGVNMKDNTNKILHRLMTNDLMSKMNIKGNKGKFPFGNTQVYKLIIETVLSAHRDATESQVSAVITSVLKYAPDRRGGSGRKKDD